MDDCGNQHHEVTDQHYDGNTGTTTNYHLYSYDIQVCIGNAFNQQWEQGRQQAQAAEAKAVAGITWAVNIVGSKAKSTLCSADYYSLSGNFGEGIGVQGQLTVDKFGHAYLGVGGFLGSPGFSVGAYKYLNGNRPTTEAQLNSFITGWSFNGSANYYIGGAFSANANGAAIGAVASTPGGDLSFIPYTFELPLAGSNPFNGKNYDFTKPLKQGIDTACGR